MPRAKASASKPKKAKKPKKPLDESDQEDDRESDHEEQKQTPRRKKVELKPEPQSEEEDEVYHVCGTCGTEFDCKDGVFSKSGKFKCSCPKEKDGGDIFFFL